ncbi:hypothetical protein Tco_0652030 [Tanacetum coccineum]|uniref:Uncharacterized protein n=1 Tax=Tanacetum coccineum TaxID=301880 RepID=A0ABQ4WWE5_9ASTR
MTTHHHHTPISHITTLSGERLARCNGRNLHITHPLPPSTGCPTQNLDTHKSSHQTLIDAVAAALPSPSLPPLPPYLSIPPPVDRRDDIPESEQPPRKRLYLSTIGSRYEIGESSTARPTRGRGIDYGFIITVDAEERRQGIRDVGYGIDLYALLEDAQDSRSRISQRADMDSQRVDLLMGDRMTLQETVWMTLVDHVYAHEDPSPGTPDTATAAGYSHSDTTSDGRDSLSHQRYEARDERHADRVV